MKKIIILALIQLRSFFNKNTISFFFLTIFVYALLQALRLRQFFDAYGFHSNILDYFMFTIGGWQNPMLLPFILLWSLLVCSCLYISSLTSSKIYDMTEYIVNKMPSRATIWFANCCSQLMLCLFAFLFILVIHTFIGFFLIHILPTVNTASSFFPSGMQAEFQH